MHLLIAFIKEVFKFSLMAVMGIVITIALINLFVIFSARQHIVQGESQHAYMMDDTPVLVLGAGVINNAYPSHILQARLDKAYEIYQQAPDKRFIMSGDHRDQYYNEVSVMKNYLMEKGIPENQIYLDHCGYSTYDSLYRLKNVIKQSKAIIVTQEYHLSRAMMVSDNLGMNAIGVAAEEVPSTRWNREAREVFARLKDFAVCYLKYQPPHPETNFAFSIDESAEKTDDKNSLKKIK